MEGGLTSLFFFFFTRKMNRELFKVLLFFFLFQTESVSFWVKEKTQ